MVRPWHLAACAVLLGFPAGCLSPVALHRAMLEYDRSVAEAESEMLLLNIARLHQEAPVHFTVTSNIAATFDFRSNAGVSGQIFERGGTAFSRNTYGLTLGASVAENPTISIVPIQGEEFARRILTPLDHMKFDFVVHEGRNLHLLLRLMGRAFYLDEPSGRRLIVNDPAKPGDYEEFRRLVMHLAALHEAKALFIGPLRYEEEQEALLPQPPTATEVLGALTHGYQWSKTGPDGHYVLRRQVTGRTVITNMNPEHLPNTERKRWQDSAVQAPPNAILIDIRPEGPGGTYAFRGLIKLRSLYEILNFVAHTLAQTPEYGVEPDPRSRFHGSNPVRTLAIHTSESAPADAALAVTYNGLVYWIASDPTASWDREAFALVYQLFQLTVTDVSRAMVPAIAISK